MEKQFPKIVQIRFINFRFFSHFRIASGDFSFHILDYELFALNRRENDQNWIKESINESIDMRMRWTSKIILVVYWFIANGICIDVCLLWDGTSNMYLIYEWICTKITVLFILQTSTIILLDFAWSKHSLAAELCCNSLFYKPLYLSMAKKTLWNFFRVKKFCFGSVISVHFNTAYWIHLQHHV